MIQKSCPQCGNQRLNRTEFREVIEFPMSEDAERWNGGRDECPCGWFRVEKYAEDNEAVNGSVA